MTPGAGTSSMQYRWWLGPSDVTGSVTCPRLVASAEEGNAERELHEGRVRIAGVSRPADARGHVDACLVEDPQLGADLQPQGSGRGRGEHEAGFVAALHRVAAAALAIRVDASGRDDVAEGRTEGDQAGERGQASAQPHIGAYRGEQRVKEIQSQEVD